MSREEILLEISGGLWQTKVPALTLPPYQHTNCYWVERDSDLLLVDTGSGLPEGNEVLKRAWQELGEMPLAGIYLTHAHGDHVGGVEYALQQWHCPVWLHPQDFALLPPRLRQNPWLRPFLPDQEPPFWPGFRWLHVPGHTPGQVNLFLEGPGILLAGDNLLGNSTSVITPPDGHLRTYLKTLRTLESLDITMAAPAHGDLIQAPAEYIGQYYQHRLERIDQIQDLLRQAPASVSQLADALYPPELHDIGARMVESHVEYLLEEQAVRWSAGGILHGTRP